MLSSLWVFLCVLCVFCVCGRALTCTPVLYTRAAFTLLLRASCSCLVKSVSQSLHLHYHPLERNENIDSNQLLTKGHSGSTNKTGLIGEWWKAPRLTRATNNSAAVTEDLVWHKGSNDIHLALPATKYNCGVLADACCGGGFTLGGEVSGRSGRRFVHVVRKSVGVWHEFFNILYFGYRYLADCPFRGTSDEWAARIKCLCWDYFNSILDASSLIKM